MRIMNIEGGENMDNSLVKTPLKGGVITVLVLSSIALYYALSGALRSEEVAQAVVRVQGADQFSSMGLAVSSALFPLIFAIPGIIVGLISVIKKKTGLNLTTLLIAVAALIFAIVQIVLVAGHL